jgi:hypothetical protein
LDSILFKIIYKNYLGKLSYTGILSAGLQEKQNIYANGKWKII